jgi:phage/plasmid-like protein (TIGR03299 family)
MSHEIGQTDSLFVAGEPAWHGLGVNVKDALSSQEALHVAGLDWTVDPHPVIVDGNEVDGYKANVASNTGTVLGITSNRYKVVNNAEAFDWCDNLLENDITPVKFESAGSLFNQKKVWILAKLADKMLLGDLIQNYLFFTNSFDGKSALTVGVSNTRVVCFNTLSMALKDAPRLWTTKHMGDMDAKKHEAARTLQLAVSYLDALNETAELWQQKKMSFEAFNTLTEMLFPMDEDDMDCIQTKRALGFRSNFIDLYNEKPDIQKFHGTAWGAYMALTDFVSHVKPARMTSTYKENLWASFMDGNKVLEQGQKAIELVTA